jgi:acetyl-CoA carboxylase biotin carboxyl carrier protein
VPSSEASSATQIAAAGKAPRNAATVAPTRSASLRAATIAAIGHSSALLADDLLSALSGPIARLFSPPMPDIEAHITGSVWKIEVGVGDEISDGDTVVILESMKMEIPVESEDDGVVKEIRCQEGQSVSEGDVLVVLE